MGVTTNYNWEYPDVGADVDTWGGIQNTLFQAVDTQVKANADVVTALATMFRGSVSAFATSTVPTGWLECDGSAVSRTTYAALFAVVGTTWGTGDGSTTFNVPDLRGEFIRGWDHGKGTDSGRAFASSQTDEFEAHTHALGSGAGFREAGTGNGFTGVSGLAATLYTATNSSGGAAETRPRNFALMYCIKT
jgi:microcystin-dependent protein